MVEGRLEKRQGATRRATECRVFLPDHHEAYIDWATYEENQRMIRRNSVNWQREESMPAIRVGQGLLVGLLRWWALWSQTSCALLGRRGTHARYLCKGDYDDGGQYCIGFGGALVDRQVSHELLQAISRFGIEASLRAIEELSAGDAAQRAALSNQLEQLEYEAQKAFEQYDTVDARNRLAAAELERRWNENLEGRETVKERLASLEGKQYALSPAEEARIRLMGENFAEIWHSDRCPPTLKKMIFRTAIEEIIVRNDAENKTLQFTIHWKGGAHTQREMERPRSATETRTPIEALEIIRRMAVRLGYCTGNGKRWNQNRVATACRERNVRAVQDDIGI